MKKIFLLISLCFILVQSYGQLVQVGAKVGINQGSLTGAPNLGAANTTSGFVCGVFTKIGKSGLYLAPELLFTQRKGVFNTDSSLTVTNSLWYMDIPILLGYKLAAFRFYAGPNFQFLLSAHQKAPSGWEDPFFSKSNFNASAVGFQGGVGVNVGKIWLDIRYDGSVGDLGKTITTSTGKQINYSTRSNMFQLTIGYRFL